MRNEKRMPKGWTHVSTNVNFTKTETKDKEQRAAEIIRNTRSKSYEDLKKESECNNKKQSKNKEKIK